MVTDFLSGTSKQRQSRQYKKKKKTSHQSLVVSVKKAVEQVLAIRLVG